LLPVATLAADATAGHGGVLWRMLPRRHAHDLSGRNPAQRTPSGIVADAEPRQRINKAAVPSSSRCHSTIFPAYCQVFKNGFPKNFQPPRTRKAKKSVIGY
jgi:hypothetical protein